MNNFDKLIHFMRRIPAINESFGSGEFDNGLWWIKFTIDIEHYLAWQVVQELGHIVNYLSIDERLPTTFYPVSPPPYMNGSAKYFLSWVIESTSTEFSPNNLQEYLEGRLPKPIDSVEEWDMDSEDEE